jgi:hypothetical protein
MKFQLQFSENKVAIFFPSKFMKPYNLSMDLQGVCGPQVKNSCNGWWNVIVSFYVTL